MTSTRQSSSKGTSTRANRKSPRQRNAQRCKEKVIETAERLIALNGSAVSINDIAREAGYSKSGVLHHFPTREHLLQEVAVATQARFDDLVASYLDPEDTKPGRWLRAYIRALCQDTDAVSQFFRSSALWLEFKKIPLIEAAIAADNKLWTRRFTMDGTDPVIAKLIERATEGIATAISQGDDDINNVEATVELLLRLSYITTEEAHNSSAMEAAISTILPQ
ncbi:MAG: TetR/AcrR family transcriptional regulator [Corynebacterium sp.]|nr:TetR/AcrR family transcriptional regulator [Corynebacterium sp.]